MDEIGGPFAVDQAPGELRGGIGERREPDVVVVPIDPARVGVGRALALIERRTADDVIGQAVSGMPERNLESRQRREGRTAPDGLEFRQAAKNGRISGNDDAYVSKFAQGAWQSRRYGSQSTNLNEI